MLTLQSPNHLLERNDTMLTSMSSIHTASKWICVSPAGAGFDPIRFELAQKWFADRVGDRCFQSWNWSLCKDLVSGEIKRKMTQVS